jgi:hypothetical protein
MDQMDRTRGRFDKVRAFIGEVYGRDLHTKRIESLAGATLGVMTSASLAVALIGHALAQARGLVTKHAVKQVDRLLSNDGIDVWSSFAHWVTHQVGTRQDILVAMDWTDFDHDDQATLVLSLVTGHGRAAALLWLSVWKNELKNQRSAYEDTCLQRLSELLPPGCRVTILASAIRSCLPSSTGSASATLSASVATSMSPPPMDRASRRRRGLARADGLASCVTLV